MVMRSTPCGELMMPLPPLAISGAPNYGASSAIQLNAANEGIGAIIQAPKTGNITKVVFRVGSTVATGSTLVIELQGVTETTTPSSPSGSLLATNTSGTQAITTGNTNTMFEVTMTAAAAVTRGQLMSVVIRQPTSSAGDCRIDTFADEGGNTNGFPYYVQNQATYPTVTWTEAVNSGALILALGYDDGTYIVPQAMHCIQTINTTSYSTSSTPDARGIRLTTDYTLRVQGAWAWINNTNGSVIKLVNENYHQVNGTGIVASVTMDKDTRSQAFGLLHRVYFDSAITLSPGTYRLIVEPTTSSNNQAYDFTIFNQGIFNFYNGANFHLTTAKDPTGDSDWTNYDNSTDGYRLFPGGLIYDGVDFDPVEVGSFTTDAIADIAAAVWDAARASYTTSGTFGQGAASVQGNVTGSVASVTGAVGSVTGNVGGNVVGSVASVTGNVGGNVVGSVDSVVDPVTVGTNNDKTGYELADGAITAAKIGTDAITSTKIADSTITANKIATDAITNAKIAADAIQSSKIASSAITANKIASDAITAAKIAADVTTELQAGLATAADLATVDTVVDAIKAKTDNLPAAPAAVSDIPTAIQNATAILTRSIDSDEASATAKCLLWLIAMALNKSDVDVTNAGEITVFKTDNTTELFTQAATQTAGLDPIEAKGEAS